jgi:hypothetical protein
MYKKVLGTQSKTLKLEIKKDQFHQIYLKGKFLIPLIY